MRNIIEDPKNLLSVEQRKWLLYGLNHFFSKTKYRILVTRRGRKVHVECRDRSWGTETLIYDWPILKKRK